MLAIKQFLHIFANLYEISSEHIYGVIKWISYTVVLIFYATLHFVSLSYMYMYMNITHSCPKLKLQPVLSFSSFVHKFSTNEHKNMKLRDNICYEMVN